MRNCEHFTLEGEKEWETKHGTDNSQEHPLSAAGKLARRIPWNCKRNKEKCKRNSEPVVQISGSFLKCSSILLLWKANES